MRTANVYEFGPFRQDADARSLTREGTPVSITPKAFDTLLYLVSNAGRTVGRDELMRAVWKDSFVEEGNLSFNISQIRKLLGERAPGAPYIQTLPKQGYRFVAEVRPAVELLSHPASQELQIAQPSEPSPAPKRLRGRWKAASLAAVAISALAVWGVGHRSATPDKGGSLIRLTSDLGLTMTPALSPDGGLIAYASDRGGEGSLHLWVQPVDMGAEAVELTHGPADDYDPSFSPDGQRIAFRSDREDGGIYVVSVRGGEVRKIVPQGSRPRFSPDGKWLAYGVLRQPGENSAFLHPGTSKIYIVPVNGGLARQIRPDFGAAGYPVWTRDGKHLLFLGNRGAILRGEESVDWFVTTLDNAVPAVATGASQLFRNMGLATPSQVPELWTGDGDGVLTSMKVADTKNLWQVPISSQNWRVSGAPKRLTFGTSIDAQPSIAGNSMAFSSLQGNVGVWSLSLDADRVRSVGHLKRLTKDAFEHAYPAVSLDGTKVAFSSRRSGNRDVWLQDLGTGKETVVSTPPVPALNPVFSPDGQVLAYRTIEKDRYNGYMVSLAGGQAERICEDCTDYGWSSDGKTLVLVGKVPARISLLNLATKRKTALLDHPERLLWNARFSPDDRWVLFNATTPGRGWIFVAPVRDSELVKEAEWITIAEGRWEDKPRWSPDGRTIYFASERDGFRCIWAQPVDAGKHPAGPAIPVFHAHQARRSLSNFGAGAFAISVARDKLAFGMNEQTGNIWMLKLDSRR